MILSPTPFTMDGRVASKFQMLPSITLCIVHIARFVCVQDVTQSSSSNRGCWINNEVQEQQKVSASSMVLKQ
jgi:hypothetical protein